MATLATLVRGFLRGTTDEKQAEVSRHGALYTQKDLPDYADLVRRNLVWRVAETTGVAALIGSTYPTTACQLALYNNESEGSGKSYVILGVTASQIAAAAALASWHVIFGVSQIKQTTLPPETWRRPSSGLCGATAGPTLAVLWWTWPLP